MLCKIVYIVLAIYSLVENVNSNNNSDLYDELAKTSAILAKQEIDNARIEYYETVENIRNRTSVLIKQLMMDLMGNIADLQEEAYHDAITLITDEEMLQLVLVMPSHNLNQLDKKLNATSQRVEDYIEQGHVKLEVFISQYEEAVAELSDIEELSETLGFLGVLLNKYVQVDTPGDLISISADVVENIKHEQSKAIMSGDGYVNAFSTLSKRVIKDIEEYLDNQVD